MTGHWCARRRRSGPRRGPGRSSRRGAANSDDPGCVMRHDEHPTRVNPVVIDERATVGLHPAPVHLVDHQVEPPVAEVLLGDHREAVTGLDHVVHT